MRTDSTTSDDTPPQEAVSLSLLQQGEPSTPTDLSELRFLLRRRSPDVAGGSTREVELSCDDLSFATNNPLLHDFPPMIMSAMLSGAETRASLSPTSAQKKRIVFRPRTVSSAKRRRGETGGGLRPGEEEVVALVTSNPMLTMRVMRQRGERGWGGK